MEYLTAIAIIFGLVYFFGPIGFIAFLIGVIVAAFCCSNDTQDRW